MAMTVLLPSFFVIQATSGGPYLSVPENLPESLPSGFLKFQEKEIWSPRAKFAVEPSETAGDDTLVNIRSCYNNKYWVAHQINDAYWVAASADKPQEDQTKPECTLFQPHLIDRGVHLFYASMSMYASTSAGEWTDGLLISGSKLAFNVVDWQTLVILPAQVSFKSEVEGKYLCTRVVDTSPHLRLESGLDAGDPHELIPTADGNYRIKDIQSGKFWRRSPSDWILDDVEENNNNDDNDFLFSFVKISDSVFALRSLGNSRFCGRLTGDEKTDCLSAGYPTITRETRLIVEDRATTTYISDLTYRLSDSRIYNVETQEVANAFATNTNSDKESMVTLVFASSESRTTKWTNSTSLPSGKVNFNVTQVPVVMDGAIALSNESGRAYEWGVVETVASTNEMTYNIVVPPLTAMKVTLVCTKASCDVPFSYTQRDVLPQGQTILTLKNDGIFTGSNSYNYTFESTMQPLNDEGKLYM
jgi:hypothetical protein